MSKFVMERSHRVEFFAQLVQHVGIWDRKGWRGSCYPIHRYTKEGMLESIDCIINSMVKRGTFTENKQPTRDALLQRIVEAVSVNPSNAQAMAVRGSRMAAYEGGFLTMDDIVHLDKIHTDNFMNEQPKYTLTYENDFNHEMVNSFDSPLDLLSFLWTDCDCGDLVYDTLAGATFDKATIENVNHIQETFMDYISEEVVIIEYSPDDVERIFTAYNLAFDRVRAWINNPPSPNAGKNFGLITVLGLAPGTRLVLKHEPLFTVTVVDDHHVDYNGKKTRLSPITKTMMRVLKKSHPTRQFQGAQHWMIEGDTKTLHQRGKETGVYA